MKLNFFYIFCILFLFSIISNNAFGKKIPNLIGVWKGENIQSSIKKGYSRNQNTIEIIEQKNRVFKGFVVHKGGKEEFVGVIRANGKDFYWVDSSDDDGKVIGEILKKNKIETCYLDSGRDAIAGCSVLKREK